jgi:hypothetical protein
MSDRDVARDPGFCADVMPGMTSGSAEESAGTDSARMWRTWLTADTAVPQGQAQQVPFCTG